MNWKALYPEDRVDLSSLTTPFSEEEIKRPFSLSKKAPEPNGFLLLFYRKFWETIKDKVMAIFNALGKGSPELCRLNHAFIVLVPKCEGASTPNDFRLISLLNGIFKIVTKVLVNRLKLYMSAFIDPAQKAFLNGRFALESVVTAQEMVSAYHFYKWEGILFKKDFTKAFDSISWSFIMEVTEAHRFPPI